MSGTEHPEPGHQGTAHLNAGARALDALPAAEAAEFDRHMADCDACAIEYAEFLETAALLAAAVAQVPPAELREKVFVAAARTPQLPPLTTEQGHAPGHEQPDAGQQRPRDFSPGRRNSRGSNAPWWRRPVGWIAAAAAIVVLVAGGVLLATQQRQLSPDEAAQRCVAAATDAQVIKPSVGTGGFVTIAGSCEAAVVRLADMPQLPTDKGYQLWVIAGDQARSEGMVTETVANTGDVVVTGLHPSDTGIGISVEPAGGSKAPTTTPVWVVPIHS